MAPLSLTFEQFATAFQSRYGKGRYHAAALYRWYFQGMVSPLERTPEFENHSALASDIQASLPPIPQPIKTQRTSGDLVKLLSALWDDVKIESVIVPMANHTTLCISSQAGCKMACRFCETGQLGFIRNLSVAEIVGQVYRVKVLMGYPVRNVVFMGMGEPLDNLENVIQAVRVLEDQRGLNIAKRHITLSTAGLIDGIRRMAAMNWPQLKLAISLNAPDDTIRTRIMPINRRYPMTDLRRALLSYPLSKKGALFFEYVLIKNVNDRPHHARQVADFLRGMKAKLNLIPYNPRISSPFNAPSEADVRDFHQRLIDEKIFVRRRTTKGVDIMAACGQLGCAGRAAISGAVS